MSDKAIDIYLNDHLAGAMFGSRLAEQISDLAAGTPLEAVMEPLAAEIEEDRQTLVDLMESMDVARNPIKQATTWIAEKASRAKFAGLTPGADKELGIFLALESLTLGVQGKKCLWKTLKAVQDQHEELAKTDFATLIARAKRQRDTLERERADAGKRALGTPVGAGR